MSLALGILDQSPVVAGADPEWAIAATIALVRRAETLGFRRYWFAEHHGRKHGFASASPELMIARLAAETQRIRLGSGGVLLQHYSPLKVAENFRLLETFAPHRVELGIGRGSGADEDTERALDGSGAPNESYAQRVGELLTFLGGGFPADHAFGAIAVSPAIDRGPEPWILGSTESGATLAAEHGVPFAYAHFIRGEGAGITAAYRAAFRPSQRFPEPRVLITVAAFCSPDASEREDYLKTLSLRRSRMRAERDPLPPTREEARAYAPPGEEERQRIEDTLRLAIVAGPADFRACIEDVAARHGATDVTIVTVAPDYASRLRSYETIAANWD